MGSTWRRQPAAAPTLEPARARGHAATLCMQVTGHIAKYLRSYAALSVELLGRWPAYVPEDQRCH